MKNFLCSYEEKDGTTDEFRIKAVSLDEATEKALNQIAEDLGYESPADQLVSIKVVPAP